MSPSEADHVIAAITARLTRLSWTPEVWADFREAMIRVKIDGEQGMTAAKNLIINAKIIPTPGHFLEAFNAARGVAPTTGSPRQEPEGYRGENWHPRGWAIVLGWKWAWDEKNWPTVAEWMPEFAETAGWLPNWEAVIDPNRAGEFSSDEVAELGLWIRAKLPRRAERGSFDKWAAEQRAVQARKVKVIAELRAKQGAKA